MLSACGRIIPPAQVPRPLPPSPISRPITQPPVVLPNNAVSAGVTRGADVDSLRIAPDDAAEALTAFRASCSRLMARSDGSGLTRGADWKPVCDAASTWFSSDARGFFTRYFETARIADGAAFATGYYEPEIVGVRTRQPGFDVPIYGPPPDLVRARPGDAPPLPDGRMPLGRYDETGRFVLYLSRAEIEDGALMGKGLEIAWAADPVELYFLQVQGSGRLRAPDGSVMQIGYAAQNGRSSTLIGSIMRQRGLIGAGPGQYSGSLEGILQYLREHPAEGRDMLRANEAYVFFREQAGADPFGALGVPVRPRSSVAADPAFVPLGAPVFLSLDNPAANGLWIAQDTGGAIKGANRFDTFWGAGPEARATAGGMTARGQALLLLPKGTLTRLGVR
ncbi:MAG: murein transglycosylase A [Sphingomonadales bacterium]|nr:murein transglycosylase A [Sphingomonadales bacterium]